MHENPGVAIARPTHNSPPSPAATHRIRLTKCTTCLKIIDTLTQATSRVFLATIVGTVPITLYVLVQYLGRDPLHWQTDSVSSVLSTMGQSNFFGAYLAMVAPSTLFQLAVGTKSSGRARLSILLGMQTVGVLLTQARAAWLALVGGAVAFVLVAARENRPAWMVAVSALLAGGALVYVAVSRIDVGLAEWEYGGSSAKCELRWLTVVVGVFFRTLARSVVADRSQVAQHAGLSGSVVRWSPFTFKRNSIPEPSFCPLSFGCASPSPRRESRKCG